VATAGVDGSFHRGFLGSCVGYYRKLCRGWQRRRFQEVATWRANLLNLAQKSNGKIEMTRENDLSKHVSRDVGVWQIIINQSKRRRLIFGFNGVDTVDNFKTVDKRTETKIW
jgi:hypothetical protein